MVKDNGGPAFPTIAGYHGMSLRDWFAGQALAGALAHHMSERYSKNDIAKQAYGMADAMLAARKDTPND